MSVSNKTYNLTPIKQLIDLNGDITNFDLTFTATSKDGSPFDLLVVDQTTLDSNPTLEYKKAQGTISGNIISDKGVYQNYFLLLKSDTPCECDVTIELKEIPEKKPEPPALSSKKVSITKLEPPKSKINWFLILIVILGGCVLLWFFYGKKNTPSIVTEEPIVPSVTESPVISQKSLDVSNSSPSKETFSLSDNTSSAPNKNLIDRLNKLKIKIET